MCDSLVGKTIDNFRLLEVIGEGGMGCVYRALDEKMDRTVAVKVIRRRFANFSLREGRALGQLNHPNIVNVFYMDEFDDGVFIAMEYVQGRTLNHFKQIPVHEALALLKQSLLALEHAHQADVIHRDIKPSNIMVTNRGTIKVMDFGLAKVNSGDPNRTVTRIQAGTVNYMSPEQIRGLHHVDHRSDIYSLGKAFYEILAGRLPFDTSDSDQFDIWKMIVEVKFKPPSHFNRAIPRGVDRIIMKAIEKDPNDRYQNARAMIEDIEKYERKKGSKPPRTPRKARTSTIAGRGKKSTSNGRQPAASFVQRRGSVLAISTLGLAILITLGWYATGIFSGTTSNNTPIDTPAPPPTRLLVTSDPPDAEILLDDDALGRTPSDTLVIDQENAHIRLSKSDYEALDTTVAVAPGRLNVVRLTLRRSIVPPTPADARFSVRSTPPGASVRIDGVTFGPTPLSDAVVSPGTHRLEVFLTGHRAYARTIELAAGDNSPVQVTLQQEQGRLVVDSNQPGASVSIDGREAGTTPLEQALAVGQYRIEVRANGFSPYSETVQIEPGAASTINAELEALTSFLRVQVYPFGAIDLDGVRVRDEEQGWHEATLPQGRHTLLATHPGFGRWEKEIDLTQDVHEIRINFLQEKRANITSGQIRGAVIYIDGEPTEFETPSGVMLRVGNHRIEVRRDGYTPVPPFIDVLIEGDEAEPLIYTFELEN